MTTDKINAGIRLAAEDIAELNRLSKQLGLSKSIVMSQALHLFSAHTNTQNASTLNKTSGSSSYSHLLGASIISKNASTLKGLDADKLWLEGREVRLAKGKTLVYKDGWLWQVVKTANGSQKVAQKYRECPEFLLDEQDRKHHNQELTSALDSWELVKGLEYIDKIDWGREDRDRTLAEALFYIFPEYIMEEALTRIEKYKATLEATAVGEPTNEEIAIEVFNDAPTPLVEVVDKPTQLSSIELTRDEFRQRWGLEDNGKYSKALNDGRDQGYLTDDGSLWKVEGKSKTAVWTMQPSLVAV